MMGIATEADNIIYGRGIKQQNHKLCFHQPFTTVPCYSFGIKPRQKWIIGLQLHCTDHDFSFQQ